MTARVRAHAPAADPDLILAQLAATPGFDRLLTLTPEFAAATPDTILAILQEATRFAGTTLASLNDVADAEGCRLEHGRVLTAPGHKEAWRAYVDGGWSTLDGAPAQGGQGLPLALAVAVQEVMDRACPAFGMLPVPQRAAVRLLEAYADADLRAAWVPNLIAGIWAATICISEPNAGSDVNRIQTRAEHLADGRWMITGEKCWISYGDHDLAARIGHCVLARTSAGLSLFLVPDTDAKNTRHVHVRRVEHKLGLHASPTCALGFEAAPGHLLGIEGRGLQQMFVMITQMRLATGAEGLGIAGGAADLALAYAQERIQGAPAGAPGTALAVAIAAHPDVQCLLLGMAARVETLRGLVLSGAVFADLARFEPEPERRADAEALLQWLLPIIKTYGGEAAFDVASDAIQVFGGAGYTTDWPVEQMLRDARVLTIFEGTTGIQALDLLNRRLLRGDRRGYRVFHETARAAASSCPPPERAALEHCLDLLDDAAQFLLTNDTPGAREAGATAFLHLALLAATGWVAARLCVLPPDDAARRRLVACARHTLTTLPARAAQHHAATCQGAALVCQFQALVQL